MAEIENDEETQYQHWCLDFANTVEWRKRSSPEEFLITYPDLVSWGQQQGVLSDAEAGHLLQEASRNPDQATMTFQQALALREALYRTFSAAVRREAPQAADLETINIILARGMAQARLFQEAGEFKWGWPKDDGALDRMLWPVARSAAELLTTTTLSRVRECEGAGCGWLFLDMSKNHSRRWCSMNSCGNRAKANRHYRRKRRISVL